MPLPEISHQRHSVFWVYVCPWSYTKSLRTRCLAIYHWWQFHQIWDFDVCRRPRSATARGFSNLIFWCTCGLRDITMTVVQIYSYIYNVYLQKHRHTHKVRSCSCPIAEDVTSVQRSVLSGLLPKSLTGPASWLPGWCLFTSTTCYVTSDSSTSVK